MGSWLASNQRSSSDVNACHYRPRKALLMLRSVRSVVLTSACFCLASLGLGACGSAASPMSAGAASSAPGGSAAPARALASPGSANSGPANSGPANSGPARSASVNPASQGFVGYDWLVVAISHDGKTTSIPAQLNVNIRFSQTGRFGPDDSVNTYRGSFTTAPGGFMTSAIAGTLIGYAGHDPAVLLGQSMMIAFNSAPAAARVTGNQLVIRVASFTLTCQRHGP